ncbi:hypothetical protein H8M03_06100 [Sphingomonas sabuli]|uniref:Uncharacterized protein n=1 Tax=Sphingomonas sabuli TaxID=2764186 RepID=A0A7G9L5I6_9SPHN|nr:hypothetical protein [Sphingomonas sabuli]QNM83885.1 hypothetical protein H8M03_06100 [Sphingomonas sabuli]
MRRAWIGILLMLAGCGEQERFAAGTWQVDAWMESDLGSTRDVPGAMQSEKLELGRKAADNPPEVVMFREFYHGMQRADVTFKDGRIEGSFAQPAVDDIAAHDVPISGTYGRDRFRLKLRFSAFGTGIDQIVEGRLVTPA